MLRRTTLAKDAQSRALVLSPKKERQELRTLNAVGWKILLCDPETREDKRSWLLRYADDKQASKSKSKNWVLAMRPNSEHGNFRDPGSEHLKCPAIAIIMAETRDYLGR